MQSVTNVTETMASSQSNPLKIQVAKHDRWETQQPTIGEGIIPPTPCRLLITGPSGSGKGILTVDLLTRWYAGCFQRIIILSPSVNLDAAWQPVKDYVHKVMGVPEEEQCFLDTWDEEKISEILETQRKVVEFQKRKSFKENLRNLCGRGRLR